jgi:hydroxypyruvate reductase 2
LTEEVANLAILLLLATTRNLVANDQYVRAGRWLAGPPATARGLQGRAVGIVGYGRIGTRIAEKLSVFSCDIYYHARHLRPEVPYTFYGDLLAMARDSDALIVALPGGDATKNLVSLPIMRALGPEGVLINVGRGNSVEETALVTALVERSLGGAGLDVFAQEPAVPKALLAMPNVILQPHQGSATLETRRKMADLFVANLVAHFSGGNPIVASMDLLGAQIPTPL